MEGKKKDVGRLCSFSCRIVTASLLETVRPAFLLQRQLLLFTEIQLATTARHYHTVIHRQRLIGSRSLLSLLLLLEFEEVIYGAGPGSTTVEATRLCDRRRLEKGVAAILLHEGRLLRLLNLMMLLKLLILHLHLLLLEVMLLMGGFALAFRGATCLVAVAHRRCNDTELLVRLVVRASAEQAQRVDRRSSNLLDPINRLYQKWLDGLGLLAHSGVGCIWVVFELKDFLGDLVEQTERLVLHQLSINSSVLLLVVGHHAHVAASCQSCLVVDGHARTTASSQLLRKMLRGC